MPVASGTAQTRFGMGGWGVRRAGSFSGKTLPASSITSETTLVIARGTSKSRLTVTQAQDEIVLKSGAGLVISTETTLIETE